MSMPLPLLILLLLPLMMMMVTPGATRSYTDCTAVTTDKETTVVCHFEEDIGQSGRGFNVQFFYPNHLEDPASEVVLMCNRRKSGGLVCRTSSDVNFDEHQAITDRLVLTRPASKDKEGGEYLCQAVPALPGPIRHCILTYIETPKQPTPSPTIPPTTEKDEDERVLPFLTVIFVFVFLIFLLFGVTLVVVIYLKRKRIRQWWTGHSKKRDVEDQAEPDQLESPSTYSPQDKPDHTGLSPQYSPPTHTSQGQPPYKGLPDKNYPHDGSQPGGTSVDGKTAQTDRQPANPAGQQGKNQQQQKIAQKDQQRQRGRKEQQQVMRRQETQRSHGGLRDGVEQCEEAVEGPTAADPLMTPEAKNTNLPGSKDADQGEEWYDAPTEPLTKAQKKKAEQERKKAEEERKKVEKERAKQEKKKTERIAREEKEAKKKADKEAKEAKRKGEEVKTESVAFLSDTADQPGFERTGHNRDLAQVHFSTANKPGKGVVTSIV